MKEVQNLKPNGKVSMAPAYATSPWSLTTSQFEISPPLADQAAAISPSRADQAPAMSPTTLGLLSDEKYRSFSDSLDVRIIVLYILFTQLYLYVSGHRRRSTTTSKVTITMKLLYLLSDLLATVALGKLSKVEHWSFEMSYFYSMWAPIILFYLGGPDTITVLDLQENSMWLRHLTGLVTLSLRTTYVLIVTWLDLDYLSLLATPMLFAGIIKYGERVWIIRSRSKGEAGFIEVSQPIEVDEISSRPKVKLVVRGYTYFQTLKPHIINDDALDVKRLDDKAAREFYKWFGGLDDVCDVFSLVEIELGFMYDALFSKIGSVFTLRGCICRMICFFCVVGELLWFFFIEELDRLSGIDIKITFIMLFGALTLEVAGLFAQLCSDWAIVWVYQHKIKWVMILVFQVHKIFRSKSKRWSESMGQFSFLEFCHKYEKTKLNGLTELVYGREKIFKKFRLPASEVQPCLERLIINQLSDRSLRSDDSSQVQNFLSSIASKRGNWTLERFKCFPGESVELDFGESILIWHIATDICRYHFEEDPDDVNILATKTLSYYMMHLLLTSSSRFPICRWDDEKMQVFFHVKKIFDKQSSESFDGKAYSELLLKETTHETGDETTVKNIKKLAGSLIEEENRWEIMSKMWVEILCYAAISCPAKNHAEELRQGGEFLTHVWLLLMHFGITKKRVEFGSPPLPDERAGEYLV